jgi:pimeloyl-ACP methyl ester carboxylesterase
LSTRSEPVQFERNAGSRPDNTNTAREEKAGKLAMACKLVRMRTIYCLIAVLVSLGSVYAEPQIVSRTAKIDNVELHYVTAGRGPAVILLHGYAETSRMWRPIIPLLAEKFTVVAPDLPGIGDSSIPVDKIDMKTSAIRIHSLIRSLGIEKARVVGHDIGLMVAYAYATQFPAQTEKLVVMDAFLPGVPGWEAIYNAPNMWHFRFNGEYPEALVKGRERTYFEYFWNVFAADKTRSIPEADRKAYTEAYSKPGRMRAAWAYFASWPQLAKEFAQLSQTKLTMPVLSIGGEKSLGNQLAEQMKLVADNVTVVVLKDTGHWILEERSKETTDALVKFL